MGVGSDTRVETIVSNPHQGTYFASMGNSTAFSSINAAWDADGFFDFLIEGVYADQGSTSGFSRSSSSIYLVPAVDSLLTIDAEFNYALGSGDRRSTLSVGVYHVGVGSVFSSIQRGLPIGGDPPIGTLTLNDTILLEAGVHYDFGGLMEISSFSGSPTNLSHADGHLRLSIAPIPEPATLTLLLIVAPALRKRRCTSSR